MFTLIVHNTGCVTNDVNDDVGEICYFKAAKHYRFSDLTGWNGPSEYVSRYLGYLPTIICTFVPKPTMATNRGPGLKARFARRWALQSAEVLVATAPLRH